MGSRHRHLPVRSRGHRDARPVGPRPAGRAAPGDRGLPRDRARAGARARARVLPLRAGPVGAVGLPALRERSEPRLHDRARRRPAQGAATPPARRPRSRSRRVRREPRVRPRPVRDQPPPRRRARGDRPRVPLQVRDQGARRPRGPARDLHRQAVERRRGLGLPSPHVAARSQRRERVRRRRGARRALAAVPLLRRRADRARARADGLPQPDDERLPADQPRGARAHPLQLGARQPVRARPRSGRARTGLSRRAPARRRSRPTRISPRLRPCSPASTGSGARSIRPSRSQG